MLQRLYAEGGPPVYCTVGDLDWWRYTDDDPTSFHHARLWMNGVGEVVGFAWLSGNRLDHVALPGYRDVEPEMVAWAEEQLRTAGEHESMTAFAYGSHDWRRVQLHALGFEEIGDALSYWHRSLDDVRQPGLPDGYTIRHVTSNTDIPERVAAHRDSFASSRMTVAKHRRLVDAPTYRSDLDLVVVAPDGSFAAFCVVWLDVANGHGVFEPVGCRSNHRRLGLSKAVMLEGMRRLQALDATTASVASHPTEVAANRLYASAGFIKIDNCVGWVRPLR
jgi:ribosomal protein S18 acetylase RimI-like enzyme